MPDDFEPYGDDFEEDDFEPYEPVTPTRTTPRSTPRNKPKLLASDFENVKLPDGSIVSKRKGELLDANRTAARPDTSMFSIDPEMWENFSNSLASRIGTSDAVPQMFKKPVTEFADFWGIQVPRFATEMFAEPESVVTPGILRPRAKAPIPRPSTARIPDEILPPAPPPKRIGAGRILSGPGGAEREINISPDDFIEMQQAPLQPTTQSGLGRGFDPAEAREAQRLEDVFYTQHEQLGGTSLDIPDKGIELPATRETGLGYNLASEAELPYPLNIIPEALRPRQAQTVQGATIPDRFADSIPQDMRTGTVEFVDEIPQSNVNDLSTSFTEQDLAADMPDMRAGTAAIMPDEPILPSAPPKDRVAPHTQEGSRTTRVQQPEIDNGPIVLQNPRRTQVKALEDEGYDIIEKIPDGTVIMQKRPQPKAELPFEDRVINNVTNNADPVIPGSSDAIRPIVEQNRSLPRQIADHILISGERQFERMGPIGNQIRKLLSAAEYRKRELYNKWAEPYFNATRNLDKSEWGNFVDTMDGTAEAMSPNVEAAVIAARKLTDEMARMAQNFGVRLKNQAGKIVPFKGLEKYWPRRPVNPMNQNRFINELMKNNPKLSRAKAMELAQEFQTNSEWFNSPQHARSNAAFEWRRDLSAMTDHIADMADIIARAEKLGAGDIGNKNSIITRLAEQAPDPTHATELIKTHLRGGMDKNNSFYRSIRPAMNYITQAQVFSKLGMFMFSNLNNQLPTALYGTLPQFGKSVIQATFGSHLKDIAKQYGTRSVGELPVEMISEMGRRPVPIVGNIIRWSENWARTVATGAGRGSAKVFFNAAKSGDKKAARKLQNLLLDEDISQILDQSELTPDQLKFATQRFVELTQQLNSGMKLPPAWVNEPLLQLPLLFKKFAFQGNKTVKDAIMQDPLRNIPLFLVASPLFGELTGDLKSIVYGVVRGGPAPEGMLDAIAFELEGRHRFVERGTGLDSDESDSNWLINRIAADYIQSWGLGLVGDMLQGLFGGKNAGYSALFGPVFDQLFTVGEAVGDVGIGAFQGDEDQFTRGVESLGREGLRSIPVVGPGLQRRFLPTESQEMD